MTQTKTLLKQWSNMRRMNDLIVNLYNKSWVWSTHGGMKHDFQQVKQTRRDKQHGKLNAGLYFGKERADYSDNSNFVSPSLKQQTTVEWKGLDAREQVPAEQHGDESGDRRKCKERHDRLSKRPPVGAAQNTEGAIKFRCTRIPHHSSLSNGPIFEVPHRNLKKPPGQRRRWANILGKRIYFDQGLSANIQKDTSLHLPKKNLITGEADMLNRILFNQPSWRCLEPRERTDLSFPRGGCERSLREREC